MRLRGLIPVLLLLAACERSAPAPEATGGRLTVSEQQRRLNKSAAAWLDSFGEGGAEEILDWWKAHTSESDGRIILDAPLPEGVVVKGWIDWKPFTETLLTFDFDTGQEDAVRIGRSLETYMDIGLFFDGFPEPESRIGFGPRRILNRYDDYWSWTPLLVFPGGDRMALKSFFDVLHFADTLTRLQDIAT